MPPSSALPSGVRFGLTEAARWIGLALPRVMVRMPYGKDSDPCEAFPFEEISDSPDPRQMLYASPAVFCALLVAQAYEASGWNLRPGEVRDVPDLPIYVYKEDDEAHSFPLVEIELTEDTAEALMDNGIMPIAGIRQRRPGPGAALPLRG